MSSHRISIERRAASVRKYIETKSIIETQDGIVQLTAHQHLQEIRYEGGTITFFVMEP